MVETQVDWKLLFMKTGLTAKGCNINGILNGEKKVCAGDYTTKNSPRQHVKDIDADGIRKRIEALRCYALG